MDKKHTVITTHINADFDALASMLAAQKLYPDSVTVFPSSNEKNLRNFFIQSVVYLFNMADIKDIDFSSIERLVLVDTRQYDRIGGFARILDRSDLEIHIYDHHPKRPDDIKGNYEAFKETGSTVAIITEIIKEKSIDISPDEATIMCLGIYEDTGSFTYSSTTEEDFTAAAFLLSKGANLNIVSNLISREISPEQVGLLNDMIQAARNHNINGIDLTITTVTSDSYIPDFSLVVHKMVSMERLDAIIAIAQMDNKIYVVARSRIPEVDMGAILSPLGGGGHAFAAAATVKDKTLAQIEQQLIEILYREVKSNRQAKDIMTSPPITVGADVLCEDANNLLTRYNVNALLVTKKSGTSDKGDHLVGYITRQVLEKALYHKLNKVPVIEYTSTETEYVGPDADLLEIQEKIIDNKQRILPVIDNGKITGVISRTDLLNILVKESQNSSRRLPDRIDQINNARTRNVVKFMKERIPKRIFDLLISIGKAAQETGCEAYAVGGFVRDLFLYRQNEDIDIDIVIEGDGIEFARKFAKRRKARVHSYKKFGTAIITLPDGFKIDVASARLEYYKFPAALPTVEMSSIKLDLFRRDFTINTLTIQLTYDKFGTLVDFFSALRDIKDKAIRVLHNLSFVEDPTRVFRAIRFEQRFGFSIGKLTSGLIENTVKMDFFKKLSGRRVFAELRQILEEENPMPAIRRLDDYNLLNVIHPSIKLNDELFDLLDSVKKVLSWFDLLFLEESYMKWAVFLLAIIRQTSEKVSCEICEKLELKSEYSMLFIKGRFTADKSLFWLEQNLPIKNSDLYKKLSRFKTELILYMMAVTKKENLKKTISNYFTRLRYIEISVTGKDLIEMGLKPGPVFKEILQAIFDAKLDGKVNTKKDELNLVRDYVS